MKLPSLPADKANHALYGAAIFIVVAVIVRLTPLADLARPIGFAAALLLGVLKEGADAAANRKAIARGESPPHSVERQDMAFTAGGAALLWIGAVVTGG